GRLAASVGFTHGGAHMGKRLLSAAIAAVAVICGAIGLVTPNVARADDQGDVTQFLSLLNQVRSSVGVRPLSVDPRLVSIAQNWSNKMAADQNISHNPNLDAQVPAGWSVIGENVGMGGDVDAIHNAFVASPHHYENMVEPRYNAVGIAVTRSNGIIYVTVDFEANANAVVSAAQAAPVANATSG